MYLLIIVSSAEFVFEYLHLWQQKYKFKHELLNFTSLILNVFNKQLHCQICTLVG